MGWTDGLRRMVTVSVFPFRMMTIVLIIVMATLMTVVYSYCMGLREIAFLLSPEALTISRGEAEGNSWCRGGQ